MNECFNEQKRRHFISEIISVYRRTAKLVKDIYRHISLFLKRFMPLPVVESSTANRSQGFSRLVHHHRLVLVQTVVTDQALLVLMAGRGQNTNTCVWNKHRHLN